MSEYTDSIYILNSIVWGNSRQPIGASVLSLVVAYSDIQDGVDSILAAPQAIHWLDGNIDEDPQFVNPGEGDYHLTEDSPCIDASTAFFVWEGDTLVNMSEDQYIGNAPDMGAFEFDYQGIDPEDIARPTEYVLMNVYPNPFNSATTISYTLPMAIQLSMQLYDLSGRRVITLFDGYQQAGCHSTTLTATDLPSGLYFVRLVASEQTFTRKIMLIK